MPSPIQVFIIYAREDEMYLRGFRSHLRVLEREGMITVWCDMAILPGENWDDAIRKNLQKADFILPLVSTDFFESEYIQKVEFKEALKRHNRGDVKIIPIIIRHCMWTPFKKISDIQVLPANGKPIESTSQWESSDAAWFNVMEGLFPLFEKMNDDRMQREERKKIQDQQKAEERRRKTEENKANSQKETMRHRDEAAWEIAQEMDSIAAYQGYLKKGYTLNAGKARLRINELEQDKITEKQPELPIEKPHKSEPESKKEAASGASHEGIFSQLFGGGGKAISGKKNRNQIEKSSPQTDNIIGIDFGTTNICLAVMAGDKPIVIVNDEGARTTPSVIGFLDNGERKIGAPAKRQAITNPYRTVFSIKRIIGMRHSEVTSEINRMSYKVVKGDNDTLYIDIDGRHYTPQEIFAMILQKMKDIAEDYLGKPVTEAVITVPAYFNISQRQAIKEAGAIAGLDVKRIVNEPTAAALAYGFSKRDQDVKIAIYDLGGGTFDISILELGDGLFEVKSTNGDTHLGGDDFDQVIIDWLADEFKRQENVDLRNDPMALQRLKEAAEKAKIDLSSSTETEINLPYIAAVYGVPKHLAMKLSRFKFEQMTDPLVQRTLEPCRLAIKDAGLKASEIDEVILVGGSTRIPRIQEEVERLFGKKPNRSINPDEVVAIGAAVHGGILSGSVNDILLLDVIPISIGIETMGGIYDVVIEANTTVPIKKSKTYSTASDNQPQVEIHILQGENRMAKENRSIGRFILDGIPPAPRGVPQIEVTFEIDANGILSISAIDKGTGKRQNVRMEV